jgi:hypothetical protein
MDLGQIQCRFQTGMRCEKRLACTPLLLEYSQFYYSDFSRIRWGREKREERAVTLACKKAIWVGAGSIISDGTSGDKREEFGAASSCCRAHWLHAHSKRHPSFWRASPISLSPLQLLHDRHFARLPFSHIIKAVGSASTVV